jgi:RNA polymerase sigma-70 factor, ECF subfamily
VSGAPRGRPASGRDGGQQVAWAGDLATAAPASLGVATTITTASPTTAPLSGAGSAGAAGPEAAVGEANAEVGEKYLVDQARQGSLEAFEILIRQHGPAAYRVAIRLVNDHHEAQAIAEKALVSVWCALQQPRTNASFSTCVYTAVIRTTRERHTGSRRGRIVTRPNALFAETFGLAGATSRQRDVDTAVAALPLVQRVPFVLHHFEGLSYADVAAITAASVPVVRSHLFRARRTLLTKLAALEVTA